MSADTTVTVGQLIVFVDGKSLIGRLFWITWVHNNNLSVKSVFKRPNGLNTFTFITGLFYDFVILDKKEFDIPL